MHGRAFDRLTELQALPVYADTRVTTWLRLVPYDVVIDVSEQRASREALADTRLASIANQDWETFRHCQEAFALMDHVTKVASIAIRN